MSKQDTYFKFMDWSFYLCFCSLSAFFMWGVLDKFISGKTSFAQSNEPIKELPTITLCFSADSIKTKYKYGLDFKLSYKLKTTRDIVTSTVLIEGKNYLNELGEIVSFRKIISRRLGNCFKFSHIFSEAKIYQFSKFLIYFNESIILPDATKLKLFFTSEINAYGLALNNWKIGKVSKIEISKGLYDNVDIRTEKIIYLPGKSNCGYESFYECFSRIYGTNESLKKCFPGTLPSHLQVCKEINGEYMKKFWQVWNKVSANGQCPKLCKTIEYFAETVSYDKVENINKNASFGFGLSFDSSNKMTTVYEEYLIYDATSMIGSVGGTLGMCIGFSFTGVTSFLSRFLHNSIIIMTNRRISHM